MDGRAEQELPLVLLLSDPTLPARTGSLSSGAHDELRDRVEQGLQRLIDWGCQQVVICCFAAHRVVPWLSATVRGRLLSLLDVTIGELSAIARPCLVLCSSATRKLELIEGQPSWPTVHDRCVFPDDKDQKRIDWMILNVKTRGATEDMVSGFDQLVTRYRVEHVLIACSELHMLNRAVEKLQLVRAYQRHDPMYSLAREVCAQAIPRPG